MTKAEQETVIRYDRAGQNMTIYTADPYLLAKLKGLPSYRIEREDRQDGQVIAATFKADKRLLTLRKKRNTKSEPRITGENPI